jgi:hypothetical protein
MEETHFCKRDCGTTRKRGGVPDKVWAAKLPLCPCIATKPFKHGDAGIFAENDQSKK